MDSCPSLTIFIYFIYIFIAATHINGQILEKPKILQVSPDTYELSATSVRLDCQASGHNTRIGWYHAESGKPVEDYQKKPATSNKMIMAKGEGQGTILILGLQSHDEGKYYCNASNPAGWTVSRNITVKIAFLRKNFVHPQNKRAKVGETVQMECKPPRGLPKPKVSWKKDGKLLEANQFNQPKRSRHYMILPNGNLRIYEATIKDSGRYQCVARNKAGKRESHIAMLTVREKPTFIRPPKDKKVNENEDVIFRCIVKGDPNPNILWKRFGGQMPQNTEILSDGSLKIFKVQASTAGRYVCEASNKVGRIEAVATLTIQSPPSYTVTPVDKTVKVGSKAIFHCKVRGLPRPTVYWDTGGKRSLMFTAVKHYNQGNSRIRVYEDNTLVINSVRKEDEGIYVCHATTYAIHIRSSAMLRVLDGNTSYPPVIKFGPTSQIVSRGKNAVLRCVVKPRKSKSTRVQWYKNGQILSWTNRNLRYVRSDDGSLQIEDTNPSDSGNFTCVASLNKMKTNLTATLDVRRRTFRNGNEDKSFLPSISDLPRKPIKVTIRDVQDKWAHLYWEPNPNFGVSQPQSYQIEVFSTFDNRGWVIKATDVHQTSYRVKGLRPSTEYWFLVRARNIHGLGAPSDLTSPVKTKTGPKGELNMFHVTEMIKSVKLVNIRLTPISVSAVRIQFEAQGKNAALAVVQGFEVNYRRKPINTCLVSGNTHNYKHCSLTGRRLDLIKNNIREFQKVQDQYPVKTISLNDKVSIDSRSVNNIIYDLKPFSCYEFEVEPFSNGEFLGRINGKDSDKKLTLTFDDVPSKAPRQISARWFANNSVEISWQPPPVDGRNGFLIGYSVHVVGNETKFNRHISTNESVHTYLVKNMLPDMAYTIHLAARTCKGEGIRSVAIRLGPAAQRASAHSVITQPWFIGTMIGVGLVWILLCLFTVYICRHRYHRNLLYKPVYFNGSLEERTQMGGGYNMRSLAGKHDPDIMPTAPPPPPPLSFVGTNDKSMSSSKEAALKNGAYATPSSILPPVAPVQNPVAPYATTSIIQNMINLQPPHSGPYYGASSDNSVNDVKGDPGGLGGVPGCGNSSSYGGHYSEGGPPGCNTCSEYSESQGEEMMAWPASIIGGRQKIKNIGEIIPPPPEYPPPPAPASGSGPMSPKPPMSVTMGTSMMNGAPVPMSVRLPPTTQDHMRKSAPDDCEDDLVNRQDDKNTLLERGCSQSMFKPPTSNQNCPSASSALGTEEGVYTGIDSDSDGQSDHSDQQEVAPMGHRSPGVQSSLVGEAAESCAGSSVLASWASGLTGDGPGETGGGGQEEISSVDSSCSDSAPFLPETDFANAVQANVGSSVPVPRRRRHIPRTPSPGYSTDSNYAALPPQPHRPYPKSERKRQMKQYTGGSKTASHPRYMYGPNQSHLYHMHGSLGSEDGRMNGQNPLTSFADSPIV